MKAAAVLDAVIGQIDEALEDGGVVEVAPGALLREHAQRADRLAAVAESVLAAERDRGGDPTTLLRLDEIASGLGAQCGQLDELAEAIERGDAG